MNRHCKDCSYYTLGMNEYPCNICDDSYNMFKANHEVLEQWQKDIQESAIGHLNNIKKENHMNNVYVTVDGKTYNTIGGIMRMGANEDIELEIEAILAPRYVTSITPTIKDVIFNPPATIIFWSDNTKTVVQARGDDVYDPEKGLAMAISKKMLGNKRDYYHTFQKYQKKFNKQITSMNYVGTFSPADLLAMTDDQLRDMGFVDESIAEIRKWKKHDIRREAIDE